MVNSMIGKVVSQNIMKNPSKASVCYQRIDVSFLLSELLLTPTGIIALIGLLSVVLAMSTRIRKRK